MAAKSVPVALTIAGSDSGGGAGIQADLQTFAALGVHGASAVTCLTAQNPKAVIGIAPCSERIVRQQLTAVFDELPPAAVKTGMLFSAPLIETVADVLGKRNRLLVVDPVMVATSGARLLKPEAIRALCNKLLPLAVLITPNLDEAELLTGQKLRAVEDLRTAARFLHGRFGCAALVKGGHLKGLRRAVDLFFDGRDELLLEAPYARNVSTHGTGCTYSAAITAFLARGESLSKAVVRSKQFISNAIFNSRRAGQHWVLGWRAAV